MEYVNDIYVEKFENGITVRLEDASCALLSSKRIATKGEEAACIGRFVWEEVCDVLNEADFDVVKVTIECHPVKRASL